MRTITIAAMLLLLIHNSIAQPTPLSGPFVLRLQLHRIAGASQAVITYMSTDKKVVDSVAIEGGQAQLSGLLSQPVVAQLVLRSASSEVKAQRVFEGTNLLFFYLTPGATVIIADDSLSNGRCDSKSPYVEDYRNYTSATKQYYDTYLRPRYDELLRSKQDTLRRMQLLSEIDSLDGSMKEKVFRAFMVGHPSSPVSLLAFRRYAGFVIDPSCEPLFDSLAPSIRALPDGQRIAELLANIRRRRPGSPAPDFTLPDTAGRMVSLSSFRGRYVLLEFWASWCGPCRMENPGLVRVFSKYKDKRFTILGVSLDRPGGRGVWLKAIEKDSLAWTNVSDLHYFDTQPARLYAIEAIPQNFLIGPDGVIIGANLYGDQLDQALAAAMAEKHPQ